LLPNWLNRPDRILVCIYFAIEIFSMYQYIYDSFLNSPRYFKILRVIENRLTDLDIWGRIDRLSLFKDVREVVKDGIAKGAKTIVAVGNDETFNKVINALPNFDVTVGLIPVGPKNKIAKILGIPQEDKACDMLSARRVEKIDLGIINDYKFFSCIEIPQDYCLKETALECDKKFYIKVEGKNCIKIYNLPLEDTFLRFSNPRDGYLEVFINPNFGLIQKFFKRIVKSSIFPIRTLFIESKESFPLLVDEVKTINTPAEIKIASQKLKIIVGKDRLF
jgi:diacylglycerol kinase family enzyme